MADNEKSIVLIVDDTPGNITLIAEILREKYKIKAANNGETALKIARAEPRPNLILLDVMMPGMSGYDVCRHLKADPNTRDIPVIFQTALSEPEDEVKGFELGAVDYITKPINPYRLMARVGTHLELSHTRKMLEFQQLQQELENAKRMQLALLPPQMHLDRLRISHNVYVQSHFQPSSAMGGDLWGCLPLDEERIGFFAFDFSGHGIAAAMNTFRLHAVMQEYRSMWSRPDALLGTLEEALFGLLPRGQYATMFFACLDVKQGRLSWSGGGHPSPILCLPSGEITTLDASGLPLGFRAKSERELRTCDMPQGASLFFYSDGMNESIVKATGEQLGDEGIASIIAATPIPPNFAARPLHQIIQTLCDAVRQPFEDDLTAVMITRC